MTTPMEVSNESNNSNENTNGDLDAVRDKGGAVDGGGASGTGVVTVSNSSVAPQESPPPPQQQQMTAGGGSDRAVDISGSGGSTANSINWEPVRSRLLSEDLNDALAAARELRGQIEVVHSTEYPLMLAALLPAFSTICTKTAPNGDPSSTEHRLRNTVLEVMSRMPSNEILRPHAPHLVAISLDVLKRDYEENALLACGIIFNLYKQYRSLPQDYVQPFLDFVMSAYRALPGAVRQRISLASLSTVPASSTIKKEEENEGIKTAEKKLPETDNKEDGDVEMDQAQEEKERDTIRTTDLSSSPEPSKTTEPKDALTDDSVKSSDIAPPTTIAPPKSLVQIFPRSNESFRVLTECPLIVMLLFQLYPRFLRSNISGLIKVMMDALALRAPRLQILEIDGGLLDDDAKRLYYSRCRDLAAAQAKTLSFLTYLLRGFSNDLKPYEDRLATNVVALMSLCPRDLMSTRKELLVATRHLLNSEFRTGFFRHVDSLLDEKVLMGSYHRQSEQNLLRPLGYTVLSDYVQHVRTILTLPQISKVVSIFSRLAHDPSIPMSSQYTSVKTLLSVLDPVYHNKEQDPQIGRDIMVRILRTLVEKLSAIDAVGHSSDSKEATNGPSVMLKSSSDDILKEKKSLIRAIVVGMKTLVWYLNSYGAHREKAKVDNVVVNRVDANVEVFPGGSKMTHTERAMIDRYITLAFSSISIFKVDSPDDQSANASFQEQYRDTLSFFAAAFTTLDGASLRKVWGQRLDLIVDAVKDDPTAIIMPRHLLNANPSTSFEFSSMMLNFLVPRMDRLAVSIEDNVDFISVSKEKEASSGDRLDDLRRSFEAKAGIREETMAERVTTATAHLQLFERVLRSLSSYPENERALRPHLKEIVSICVRNALEKNDFRNDNYCMLLRYAFRSISAGKFEDSYRELLPLIPTVLNGFFRVVSSTEDVLIRHNLMELILTIPARLSSLLPHMQLLLRVIVMALEAQVEELANLGLRTLEFWVDNLNPEFLFPQLSRQKDVFVALMRGLATHLRPAPYPYGLLTLRLLGKIGGKNRKVLREPMDVTDPTLIPSYAERMKVRFAWSDEPSNSDSDLDIMQEDPAGVDVDLPIEACVRYLRQAALWRGRLEMDWTTQETEDDCIRWHQHDKLLEANFDVANLVPYCSDVVNETRREQIEACVHVLRTALIQITGDPNDAGSILDWKDDVAGTENKESEPSHQTSVDMQSLSARAASLDNDLKDIALGLMYACACDCEDQIDFVKGMLTSFYLVIASNEKEIIVTDANGSPIESQIASSGECAAPSILEDGEQGHGSIKPFGHFQLNGPLAHSTNPLAVNAALADFLSEPTLAHVGINLLDHLLSLPSIVRMELNSVDKEEKASVDLDREPPIYFENLLDLLCDRCLSANWDKRTGLQKAISLMIEKLGASWGKKYETNLMNIALFSLKNIPKEASIAGARSFEFLIDVCGRLYGKVSLPKDDSNDQSFFVHDALSPLKKKSSPEWSEGDADEESTSPVTSPNDEVIEIVIPELTSTFNLSRLGARFVLTQYIFNPMKYSDAKACIEKHMTLIRRLIFSRSLRVLPLQEKIGSIEALAVLIDRIPELISITDQHLLAFLSELLKMASIADGEMTDSNSSSPVVDRDGFVLQAHEVQRNRDVRPPEAIVRPSSLFLRRYCVVVSNDVKFLVEEELPPGVQFRVSSIILLRSVIRGYPDAFFDSEPTTPVGNIRPHVISLLFRSLVSQAKPSVVAAHDTLRDVLTLSVVTEEGDDGLKTSRSRLKKELLQTCIRPVLLNLRDYTRLTTQLVLGLSQLLSLLSSWFNKTLGEKLVDHLQKWTDPNAIRAQKLWREGEEPDVAASILGLFHLLPHASHFVEVLVKTTIKLEACLPAYKSQCFSSPYRKPLALYLNKYSHTTVGFFLPRLKTPFYTELFIDILHMEESKQLREFLSGRQCSNTLLNVAFERSLNIVRSEKNSGAGGSPSRSAKGDPVLEVHGIMPFPGPKTQREVAMMRDIETKEKKLRILQLELSKSKDTLQVRSSALHVPVPSLDAKTALEDAKKNHKIAKTSYDRGLKEVEEAKKRYKAELARSNGSQTPKMNDQSNVVKMDVSSLEVQHIGFEIIQTLVQYDAEYLSSHTDVLRAFRWLWRSKGRYLRMQHDESISPRFHGESKCIASVLISYSKSSPQDIDLLYELARIFLQTTTTDFSSVQKFLNEATGSLDREQQNQIINRFFDLMGGDSTEEIKVLSLEYVVIPTFHSALKETSAGTMQTDADGREPAAARDGTIEGFVIQKFVSAVLFAKDGSRISCGDKLNVALLRLSNLFLKKCSDIIDDPSRNKLLEFCLPLSRSSEDPACKAWSYLTLCRLLSLHTFDPSDAVVLQVYSDLLKASEPDFSVLTKEALDLLVAALPRRLDNAGQRNAIDIACRMMFEENNVNKQAHILQVIVDNPPLFASRRAALSRFMVAALPRFALPMNSRAESRLLAVKVVSLVMKWERDQETLLMRDEETRRDVNECRDSPKFASSKLLADSDERLIIDQSMVDTMVNFLIRLQILLADPKIDRVSNLDLSELVSLFREIVKRWKGSEIRPAYFEKVVAMCAASDDSEWSKISFGTSKRPRRTGNTSKEDDVKNIQGLPELLSTCLDIFTVLVKNDPHNLFLYSLKSPLNSVLSAGFRYSKIPTETRLRKKLGTFLIAYLDLIRRRSSAPDIVSMAVKVWIDRLLLDTTLEYKRPSGAGDSTARATRGGRHHNLSGPSSEDCASIFALRIIQDVGASYPLFPTFFTKSLLGLLQAILQKHLAQASAKQKQEGVTYSPHPGTVSIRQMYPTRVSGILVEIGAEDQGSYTIGKSTVDKAFSSLNDFDDSLKVAVAILRLLGKTDILSTYNNDRKVFISLLQSILDGSNCVQLLLATVQTVGSTLLKGNKSGLTSKERNNLTWKMSSFDFNSLSDVTGQPLADLVSLYMIRLCERAHQSMPEDDGLAEMDGMAIYRSIQSCLINANTQLRRRLLDLYTQTPKSSNASSLARILRHFFYSDFEGLGGRFWLVVFIEVLINQSSVKKKSGQVEKQRLPPPRLLESGSGSEKGNRAMASYEKFVATVKLTTSDLLNGGEKLRHALCFVAHGDSRVCLNLFQSVLPGVWSLIRDDSSKLTLTSGIETLLSRPFYSQSFKIKEGCKDALPSNTVKAFLSGIIFLDPLPPLNVDLIVYLAENYNSWYEALSILERQYLVLSSVALSKDENVLCEKLLLAMRRCYRQLGETSVWTTLVLKSCDLLATERAASLEIYGRVDQALSEYTSLMNLVATGELSGTSKLEMKFWEEEWVKLQREECQLEVVSNFASQTNNAPLMLECAWKECNWDKVRSLCASPQVISIVETGDPALKMVETLSAVAEGKLSEVENLHAQSSQLCLYKWRLLPNFTSASQAHARLLHNFHRLVEIRESGQIMVETNHHSSARTVPDLKNLLNSWRHRLPNDEEDLTIWDDIFFWRAHMFSAVTSNFQWTDPGALTALHDKPWTTIRMSTVARKQALRNTALLLLNRLADGQSMHMDVSDAFSKLREQILLLYNPDDERERTGGLNLINTTNLSYFDDAQKSELFRLKAIFLASLRRTSKSNQAYCHSVQICPTHSKSWISWGGLCSSLGAMTEKQADQAKASGNSEEAAKSERERTKRVAQYLAQAMGCFLEAVQVDPVEKTRIHLPKCLWMLTKDGPLPGVLCQTLEQRGITLPPFVWLPWIPQLLSGLCRSEGRILRNILSRVVKAYPQAVYYSLRAFYLERRDVERSKGASSAGTQQHMGSVAYAEDMMSTLRRSHSSLWSSLESLLEELIVRFRPSYEEELLATISALLERAESHLEKRTTLPNKKLDEEEEAMVVSWSKTLSRIAAKFFCQQPENVGSSGRRDERRMKTAEFKRKYKEDFERDFQVGGESTSNSDEGMESTKPQFTLAQYIDKLTLWKEKLETQVSRSPRRLPLISSSRSLGMFVGIQPDLWPGSCDTRYSNASHGDRNGSEDDFGIRNFSSTSSSATIALRAAVSAAKTAAAGAARDGIGGEIGGGSSAIEIPGQYVPNTSASDLKPSPELHAKLVRFEPFIEVLPRSDQLVRRCGMIGSDGKTYRYLLQFAIPYWTRTDERTAQVHYVVDQFLRKDIVASRNYLSVQPTAAIPVAQRLRMCRDMDSRLALDDVLRRSFDSQGKDTKEITSCFLKAITSKLKDKLLPDASEEEKTEAEREVRLEVYNDICLTMVDKRMLLRYLLNGFKDQEEFYLFRRAFSVQLAANSLLQYAFAVAERTPQRVVIQQSTGQVMSPDFRVSYSNQGFIEGHAVPYRLTPNIEHVIGEHYLEGEFIRAMTMIAGAVKDHRDEFDPILRLLMRDDILAWYSKSMAKTDSKTQELERQLIERVAKNVHTIQSRISECSPSNKPGDKNPLDTRTKLLMKTATDPKTLCLMHASYHAWL